MENPKLTITLTGKPPVKINKADWPILAEASDNDTHGAQIGNEPNRETDWWLKVRQHADGRTIVYGVYSYDTHFQGERRDDARRGELLEPGADVLEGIQRVASDLEEYVKDGAFARLAQECIANLPAVEI